MNARLWILALLLAVLIVPFALRPKRPLSSSAQDVVVVITPHNEALRSEFARGFRDWYQAKTGRTVVVDWRVIGGTSEIARYLEGEYVAEFQRYWTKELKKNWSTDVQAGFQNGRLGPDASREAREARAAFLASDVSCGIDVFFGGGPYDFIAQAQAGRLIDSGMFRLHPDWFTDQTIPQTFAGETYWDKQGLWIGAVLSDYGIIYNRDVLRRIGFSNTPAQWTDLGDGRFRHELAVADPTKSGSIIKVFENILQQQMQRRWAALRKTQPDDDPKALEARAVREGWLEGMKLLQRIGANARYFTDTSQKPPIDVAQGEAAAGLCIDFYGRQQVEAVTRRAESGRAGFVAPINGSVASVDPIAMLRGAPHRTVALAFMEYVLSLDGQKLWDFKAGTPGGPAIYTLRRLPVRRDFYSHGEFRSYLADPDDNPFADLPDRLTYHTAWTGGVFREIGFIVKIMCMDPHDELARAWNAVVEAGQPPAALDALQDMTAISYDEANGRIKRALGAKDKTEELRLTRELTERFREQYARAESLAHAVRENRAAP